MGGRLRPLRLRKQAENLSSGEFLAEVAEETPRA
jgi:hypothetical protein